MRNTRSPLSLSPPLLIMLLTQNYCCAQQLTVNTEEVWVFSDCGFSGMTLDWS